MKFFPIARKRLDMTSSVTQVLTPPMAEAADSAIWAEWAVSAISATFLKVCSAVSEAASAAVHVQVQILMPHAEVLIFRKALS